MTHVDHSPSWLACRGNLDELRMMVGEMEMPDCGRIEWTMDRKNQQTASERDLSDLPEPAYRPIHDALELTQGGRRAQIQLDDKTYTLCITKSGKLILTK
ncbi:MAG: hemin uptake protein HemP [Pelagimonas sp.]|uniref:hemin uptake protein HemP n=1 Tax=Pelagimonas sp. TaxID=2073170 RepID=UPI003D6C6189